MGALPPEPGSPPGDPYRELFEHSPDAILIIEGGRFVDCNEATARMLRFSSRDELLRRFQSDQAEPLSVHPAEFSPPSQPDGQDSHVKAEEMMRIAFEQGHHRFEWDHMRADGEVFPVEVQLVAFSRGDKRLLHVVWREITERKKLEAELRQAQKLEAIGKLAGGLAHDFNNLLLVIQGHASLLREEASDQPLISDHVSEIEKASMKAATLTQQMLAFSRRQVLRMRTLDLAELVRSMASLLSPLIGEHIQFHTELPSDPAPVRAAASQLEQVIVNLITNARDAMPSGGELWVRVSMGRADFEGGAGDAVVLTVQDSGIGMPPQVAEKAFDPFFTTKEQGQGTGLGLATVHGIVRQSGGVVELQSTLGTGTAVRVCLPRSDEPIERAAEPATPQPRPATGQSLLLVEDEAGVRELLERVLTEAGYEVHTARDGQQALDLVLGHADEFDLLLTDVVMPRVRGDELARRVAAAHPKLRILLMSGYIRDAPVDMEALAREFPLIEKPFRPADLLTKLRETLRPSS